MDPSRLEAAPIHPVLFKLSPEERVYRVLFLVSIRLLSERRIDGAAISYAMPAETAEVLPLSPAVEAHSG